MITRDDLERRLRLIVTRLAEIAKLRPSLAADSYRRQEIGSEANALAAERAHAERQLQALSAQPNADSDQRREAYIDAVEREQRVTITRFIAKLESEGDHRNAKLWRLQLIGLREQIAGSLR